MSKLTDYGTVILAYISTHSDGTHSAAEISASTGLAPPTVSKILKKLAGAGVLASFRGPHGGYSLARDARQITAAEIIDALEGPIAITECSGDHSQCSFESVCSLGGRWQHVNQMIRDALDDISLADLAGPGELRNIGLKPAFAADQQRLSGSRRGN